MQGKMYKGLILPKLSWQGKTSKTFGELVVEPLESGYGVTLGNALRRIMLASIEGAAVTSVVIEGVNNEFAVIPGVVEDVLQVVLNIKGLVVHNTTGESGKMRLVKRGRGPVYASDISCDAHMSIVNPDHLIANLAEDGKLDIDFFVEMGRGYVPAQWPYAKSLQQDGRIYVDALFSPVQRVEFRVEKTRVGEAIDYDKLYLSVTTNGAVKPPDVVHYAASVLRTQLEHFLSATEIPFNEISVGIQPQAVASPTAETHRNPTKGLPVELFLRPIDELEFSVRAHNCLIGAGVKRVIDLVNLTDDDILKIKNFGRKSLREVKEILQAFNLSLGMNVKELDLKRLIKEQEDEAGL
ncbi:MAG: DNA-directed polymerase subunit alpha [Candidatus Dependentiae bacterium]|nr:DNA-directed polymerase subunit alpha [Candidatus Dependentiae bacterium]